MRSEIRTALAALVAVAVVLVTASATVAATPRPAFTVSDAQLRWGFNNESNNRAFAPGTFNFFSAGKIANPGRGGVTLKESGWDASTGDVRIEKFSASSSSWSLATWAGLRTDSTGAAMAGTNGPFSNHEVVVDGGTGTVDPDAGTATIRWTGSFTVLYYSGYSFFYVTDPELTVKDGVGTLTATLSGYGSSMTDLDRWEAIEPVDDVVLARLGAVDLDDGRGFDATPAYRGVEVDLPAGQTQQVRSGDAWGSFPQSFIDYQVSSGSGSYWYASGGSTDAHKVALPVTVSYSADEPVETDDPPTTGGGTTTPTNDAVDRPAQTPAAPPAVTSPPIDAPVTSAAVRADAGLTRVQPMSTVLGAAPPPEGPRTRPVWILGGALLGAAVVAGASPFVYAAARRRAT